MDCPVPRSDAPRKPLPRHRDRRLPVLRHRFDFDPIDTSMARVHARRAKSTFYSSRRQNPDNDHVGVLLQKPNLFADKPAAYRPGKVGPYSREESSPIESFDFADALAQMINTIFKNSNFGGIAEAVFRRAPRKSALSYIIISINALRSNRVDPVVLIAVHCHVHRCPGFDRVDPACGWAASLGSRVSLSRVR